MQTSEPACRQLGCGDQFDGKGAGNQIHSCLDSGVSLGLGVGVEERLGAFVSAEPTGHSTIDGCPSGVGDIGGHCRALTSS